eukprot:1159055-Pelagomonas_calceolata.AAC.6
MVPPRSGSSLTWRALRCLCTCQSLCLKRLSTKCIHSTFIVSKRTPFCLSFCLLLASLLLLTVAALVDCSDCSDCLLPTPDSCVAPEGTSLQAHTQPLAKDMWASMHPRLLHLASTSGGAEEEQIA